MLSKNLLELKALTQKLKPLLKKYREILEDIIIFGSLAKGKDKPNDIDIALVVSKKDNIDNIQNEIKKIIKAKVDFVAIGIKETYSVVWLSIMKEGYSISRKKFLSEIYGISPIVLYKYSLKKMTATQKVQFDRGLKIVLKELEGTHLVRTIVLIPQRYSEKFDDFLKTWNIEYETTRYELISEFRKDERFLPK